MSDTKFLMARRLSVLSVELDELKNELDSCFFTAAVNCVKVMQDMAEVLAGDRVGEIYDQTEEVAA